MRSNAVPLDRVHRPPSDVSDLDAGRAGVRYDFQVSAESEDAEWDAFLASTPGGHHTQTSLWAQVKASVGWEAARVIARHRGRIVGGAQLLHRRLPLGGAIGYVPRGPLVTADAPDLVAAVMDALLVTAKRHRVQYLSVQPPSNLQELADALPRWGFRASPREVEPTATVVLDLNGPEEALLAGMKMRTRYNVRLAARKGITVREGTEADIATFHRLMVATAGRQHFSAHPAEYYARMWRILAPRGHAVLLVAEYEGEPVSTMFAIAFGTTVYVWRTAWSGLYGQRRPNEALQWAAISWARSHGYAHYDFEGIDPGLARAVMHDRQSDGRGAAPGRDDDGLAAPAVPARDEAIPVSANTESVASFKLGFGGRIVLSPGAYDFLPNPLLRWGYRSVVPRIARWPLASKLENLMRGTQA